jgi:hypothetical protein
MIYVITVNNDPAPSTWLHIGRHEQAHALDWSDVDHTSWSSGGLYYPLMMNGN